MGHVLRWTTAGESHGRALIAVVEGMVAGLSVTSDDIADQLARGEECPDHRGLGNEEPGMAVRPVEAPKRDVHHTKVARESRAVPAGADVRLLDTQGEGADEESAMVLGVIAHPARRGAATSIRTRAICEKCFT